MGLDMYLSARRTFHPTSAEADANLSLAGVKAPALASMSAKDPMQYETSVYLPMWNHCRDETTAKARAVIDMAGLTSFVTEDSPSGDLGYIDGRLYVSAHCLYWRKVNAVHSWFVENCQDGIDECQETEIHVEQLAALRSACLKAVAAYEAGDLDVAEDAMTPRGGFFFGSTNVDEYWASSLARTATGIERVVNLAIETGGVDFTYQSSW